MKATLALLLLSACGSGSKPEMHAEPQPTQVVTATVDTPNEQLPAQASPNYVTKTATGTCALAYTDRYEAWIRDDALTPDNVVAVMAWMVPLDCGTTVASEQPTPARVTLPSPMFSSDGKSVGVGCIGACAGAVPDYPITFRYTYKN